MKKVVFRADGNAGSGLGHLYRIFALMEMCGRRLDHVLVTSASSTTEIIPPAYKVQTMPDLPASEEPAWLAAHFSPDEYLVVADGYQFGSIYQRALKALGYRLIYIDDFAKEHMHADVVVNHSLGVEASDYKAQPYTEFALGTKYAILRPSFLDAAAKVMGAVKAPSHAFVCFGGTDPQDLTSRATRALLQFPEFTEISVVTGAAYSGAQLQELAESDARVKWHRNLGATDLARLMSGCNFALASASNILYEICAVKMPVLAGYYVDNQVQLYNGALERGAIMGAGNISSFTVTDFKEQISRALKAADFAKMLESQSEMFDAHIRGRFLRFFLNITYRKALPTDVMLLFDWANDKVSRANSYFSEPIKLETHKAWFSGKLADPNSSIYIAQVDGAPAGMVRYDREEGEPHTAVVGIVLDAGFRGYGLAGQFLKDTATEYFDESGMKNIRAYIKKENKPSLSAFENAGYRRAGEELVHEQPSWRYGLSRH